MKFHEKLRILRTRAGLSQQQLADALNVSRAAVAKWENDNGIPDVVNLKVLAGFFQCDLDRLLDDSKDLDAENKPESYCGKDCRECADREGTNCPGCLCGPGGRYYKGCEIGVCCRTLHRTACEGCSSYDDCLKRKNSPIMPKLRAKREQEEKEQLKARKRRAQFLKKWLWVIFLLLIPRVLAGILTGQPSGNALYYIGASVMILSDVAHGLIYLRLSVFDKHLKEAGLYYLGVAGVQLFLLLLTGGQVADMIKVLSLIPTLVLQLYCFYNECRGYSGIILEFDSDLSDHWLKLWRFYGVTIGTALLSILIFLIFRSLGVIVLLASSLGTIACSIWMLILQYKSAKAVSEFA